MDFRACRSETDVVIEKLDKVKQKEFKTLFCDTLASNNQEKVMEDFLRKYFEEVIRTRSKISEPNAQDLIGFVESLQ